MLSVGYDLQNRYHILAVLGQGGMGAVYRARDMRLDAVCVVKEMLVTPETLANPVDAADQFKREASVLAMLRHPHLPRVIDYFVDHGNGYLVMDYIEGQSLLQTIGTQGLPEATVRNYANQLLDVLEYIHGMGVLHRDIKPGNIIVQPSGRLVLVDFGLVKMLDSTAQTRTFLRGVGTPEYAPPEQATGGTDARSDIYSLGATLYHALTGQPPPHVALRSAGSHMPDIHVLLPAASPQIEWVVNKAMQLNRELRYQAASAMKRELNERTIFTPPGVMGSTLETSVIPAAGTAQRLAQNPARSKRLRTIVAIAAGALILLVAVVVLRSVTDSPASVNTPAVRNLDVAALATPVEMPTKQPTAVVLSSATPVAPANTLVPLATDALPTATLIPLFPTAFVASTSSSYPRIDRIVIPESVQPGEAFEIEVYATNLGIDARGGGSLSLSFPAQSGKLTVKSVTILDADSPIISSSSECKLPDTNSLHTARVYSSQTKCKTATISNCSRRINIAYPITEIWHKPWLSQDQHHFKVRVLPMSNMPAVRVYVRASFMDAPPVRVPCSPITVPSSASADAVDQQGFPVSTYVVNIR